MERAGYDTALRPRAAPRYLRGVPGAPEEAVFIVNGRARAGAQDGAAAREALVGAGFAVKAYHLTNTLDQFQEILQDCAGNGEPLVVVGGGDGTQRAAASLLAGTETALGVFPLGTGNAWAADLGVPGEPSAAAAALAAGRVGRIDLGTANGHAFVNVATVGLTALIVKNLSRGVKGRFGRLAYLPAVIRSLSEVKPFDLHVAAGPTGYDGQALLFVAAAGRTHAGPFKVTMDASNADGLLSLYALDKTGSAGLAKFGIGLLTGLHTLLGEVWSCEATCARVTTRPSKRVITDGEPLGRTPLQLEVRPGALKVLLPRKSTP